MPVMELSDPAEDIDSFLKSLYYFHPCADSDLEDEHDPDALPTFPDAWAGILRLASKYDAPGPRAFSVRALRMAWPRSLGDWDCLQTLRKARPRAACCEPAKLILLAQEYGVPTALPALYYELLLSTELAVPAGDPRRADIAQLGPTQLCALVFARGAVLSFVLERIKERPWHDAIAALCMRPGEGTYSPCNIVLEAWWGENMRVALEGDRPADGNYFAWLNGKVESWDVMDEGEVCVGCHAWLRDWLVGTRESLWRALPELFGLQHILPKGWDGSVQAPAEPAIDIDGVD
ncbi:hypothetical protein FA95DRAFT_1607270 [Auriscalpium vulgare]|uniref:Uncharacterized protein n=1 Tax=Auriscalpium vulgare TaxID=40419 RepID=A0ACB8RPV6_9AGAM|nr:hypothetical protein FA95DRAFT_1607270 [Auriscalpium vulgare]